MYVLRRVLLQVEPSDADPDLAFGVGTSMWPPVQIGSSNWEIWYPLGRSG